MLTDVQIRKAKGGERPYKLADAGGLFLLVSTTGHRSWRMKYRFGGKEKLLTFGPYPEVTLVEARDSRDDARRHLRAGRDPSVEKKKEAVAAKLAGENSFELVAREWYAATMSRWAPVHANDVIISLERDVFKDLGALPIRDITPALVLSVLRPVEKRGAIETAKRIRQRMSAVFVYAIASGLCDGDPAAVVSKALQPLPKKGRQPAITSLGELGALLTAVEAQGASPITKLAHRLLALTAVRPGEIRGTAWSEFEGLGGNSPIWRIPAARMKLKLDKKDEEAHDHIVPLTQAAVDVINAIRPLTGRAPYVFPNQRHTSKPMSENAIGYLINRAGYHGRHVPHGWRAAFSTVMNERRPADRAVIDAMLAHTPKEKVEAAYNRAVHLDRRREIANEWAGLVMEGRPVALDLMDGPRRGRNAA